LIVFDDELFGSPSGLVHVLHQGDPIFLEGLCRGDSIVGFKVEVEVLSPVDERDGRVLLVDEFQVEELIARPNPIDADRGGLRRSSR
jgi:hypothetical protein